MQSTEASSMGRSRASPLDDLLWTAALFSRQQYQFQRLEVAAFPSVWPDHVEHFGQAFPDVVDTPL